MKIVSNIHSSSRQEKKITNISFQSDFKKLNACLLTIVQPILLDSPTATTDSVQAAAVLFEVCTLLVRQALATCLWRTVNAPSSSRIWSKNKLPGR